MSGKLPVLQKRPNGISGLGYILFTFPYCPRDYARIFRYTGIVIGFIIASADGIINLCTGVIFYFAFVNTIIPGFFTAEKRYGR